MGSWFSWMKVYRSKIIKKGSKPLLLCQKLSTYIFNYLSHSNTIPHFFGSRVMPFPVSIRHFEKEVTHMGSFFPTFSQIPGIEKMDANPSTTVALLVCKQRPILVQSLCGRHQQKPPMRDSKKRYLGFLSNSFAGLNDLRTIELICF